MLRKKFLVSGVKRPRPLEHERIDQQKTQHHTSDSASTTCSTMVRSFRRKVMAFA